MRSASPVSVMVTVSMSVDQPTFVFGTEGVDAEKVGAGIASPVAVRVTLCGEPDALSVNTRLAVLDPVADGEKL